MNDLFSHTAADEPLAARMRPRHLDEFIGQDHIVGPGRLLRRAIAADQLASLIFYGPPGTGKTTLARVIAGGTKSRFVSLNAVLTGVADIRKEITRAQDAHSLHGKRSILFVDEVHRWNKSQQDALLPWVENGTVVLIGATTENPFFEVNKALVSRSRIFQLTVLNTSHLIDIALQAINDKERGYGRWVVQFAPGALEHLVKVSAGDARSLLNALQLAIETSPKSFPPAEGTVIQVSMEAAEESIQRKAVLYDKEGDYHFDTISAFIKSLRGSDPDAALYWMALMIRAGEDPRFIFRRMLISACEDVGLANPEAVVVVQSCAAAFDRVGLPEGQYHLTHAALYLATAPKSNSSLGYFDALQTVTEEENHDVPKHLRDANRDKHAFGHGEGYKYPHAWREHWTAQQYLPDGLAGRIFYRPGELGYEGTVRPIVFARRENQVAAILDQNASENTEILTFSPGDDERERWVRRTESAHESLSVQIRDALFSQWNPQRHDRVFIPHDPGGVLLWEAHRRVPEGGVTEICNGKTAYDALSWLAGGMPVSERPHLICGSMFDASLRSSLLKNSQTYDVILARNWMSYCSNKEVMVQALSAVGNMASPKAFLHLAEAIPGRGTSISEIIAPGSLGTDEKAFKKAEADFFNGVAINDAVMHAIITKSSWCNPHLETKNFTESRNLTPALLKRWFQASRPNGYGPFMAKTLGTTIWTALSEHLMALLAGRTVEWTTQVRFITANR